MDLKSYFRILLSFVVLLLLQILVLNNISLTSLGITPFFHLLFILSIPFEMPSWIMLIAAFALGFNLDIFCDTSGINAASCTFMAYLRPFILRAISPRDGYESGFSPDLKCLGAGWYIKYSLSLIFLHNVFYFFLDAFGFDFLFGVISKILLTTVLTFMFIFIAQFLFSDRH